MRAISKRLLRTLFYSVASSPSPSIRPHFTLISTALRRTHSHPFLDYPHHPSSRPLLIAPWHATQLRGAKSRGADLRPGNVIERKGKIYEIVKAQHTTQGRGGAIIQVELRDVDSGNKVNERFRTDEMLEKVHVSAKSFTYLYTDEDSNCVVLMDPDTYVQLDVPKHLFGDSLRYLQDDMTVKVELHDERPMSASVPKQVTCTVVEAEVHVHGMGATAHTKKVVLDNGLTLQVPSHVSAGDKLVIDTNDGSYISRV